MPMRTLPALLAVAATVTAACLSIMAGWQRGGFLAERVLWIAVGVVLDPFMGSGSTGIAARQLGRHFIGCEDDPKSIEAQGERSRQSALDLAA